MKYQYGRLECGISMPPFSNSAPRRGIQPDAGMTRDAYARSRRLAALAGGGLLAVLALIAFFNITPVIRATTLIPGGLYTDTFWIAFNERSWNGLTDAQKAAVTKHSGLAIALQAGWAWTMGDRIGQTGLEQRNVRFNTLPPEEVAQIVASIRRTRERARRAAGEGPADRPAVASTGRDV